MVELAPQWHVAKTEATKVNDGFGVALLIEGRPWDLSPELEAYDSAAEPDRAAAADRVQRCAAEYDRWIADLDGVSEPARAVVRRALHEISEQVRA